MINGRRGIRLTALCGVLLNLVVVDAAWGGEPKVPEFNMLRTPDAPAFVILGLSPTEIQRPTTPREVAISLGTVITSQEDLTIPKSLALEVAPYWLVSHHKLTLDKYASNVGRPFRDFTFSLGTTTADVSDSTGGQPTTKFAIGVRTNLVRGEPTSDAKTTRARIEAASQEVAVRAALIADQAVTEQERALANSVKSVEDSLVALASARMEPSLREEKRQALKGRLASLRRAQTDFYRDMPAVIETKQREVLEAELEKVEKLASEEAKKLAAREGFIGSLAAGCSWRFPEGKFGAGQWDAARGWLTLGYEGGSGENILLSARYGGEDKGEADPEWSLDLGTRGLLARARYAVSAELMFRSITSARETGQYRVATAIDYMVHDGSWLTISFGKDFEGDDLGSLFTLASLKWGFGNPSIKVERDDTE